MKDNLLNHMIIFLFRKKFNLKKYQPFRFENQKSTDEHYYFTDDSLKKMNKYGRLVFSKVSLDWLLNKDCNIIPVLPDHDAWLF